MPKTQWPRLQNVQNDHPPTFKPLIFFSFFFSYYSPYIDIPKNYETSRSHNYETSRSHKFRVRIQIN